MYDVETAFQRKLNILRGLKFKRNIVDSQRAPTNISVKYKADDYLTHAETLFQMDDHHYPLTRSLVEVSIQSLPIAATASL